MQQVLIQNQNRSLRLPIRAGYCDSFISRLRGFMFSKGVEDQGGLLLVQSSQSRMDAAIHMFFVPFDLGVIWINQEMQVVDTCLAKAWRPFYMPAHPAKYILEIHPDHLSEFKTGDQVTFDHA
jgi:uncharacterized membrane protein (UPF0127 family)